jgi:hypothetical protein
MTRRLTALLAAALVAASLALAACGGDDDEDATSAATTATTTETGATGATGATGSDDTTSGDATYDITTEEFVAASLPDQVQAVQDYVADASDECGGVDDKPGSDFQVSVAIAAASAEPQTPLADVILAECEKGS